MSKKPKKPHYIRPPIEPEWEDEQPESNQDDSKQRQLDEEQMFLEAIEHGRFTPKDQQTELATNRKGSTQPKKQSSSKHQIDLHGFTVSDAQDHVINAIENLLAQAKGQALEIRIITGKGNHSKGRDPQLIKNIHHIVESRFKHRLIHIEVSPHEIQLGGIYLKGHFDLKIK